MTGSRANRTQPRRRKQENQQDRQLKATATTGGRILPERHVHRKGTRAYKGAKKREAASGEVARKHRQLKRRGLKRISQQLLAALPVTSFTMRQRFHQEAPESRSSRLVHTTCLGMP